MTLRCKPGDLAVIVGALPAGKFLIGRFCDVLERTDDGPLGATWEVRLHHPINNPVTNEKGQVGWAADVFLRPIRDPGDDAVDETLRQLEAA